MRRPRADGAGGLPVRHALALGALHGAAELLPVSSSAHVELVPWLLGWPVAAMAPDLRKAFEVALHVGAAAGLIAGGRRAPSLPVLVGGLGPPAVVGLALEGPIERRLGTPRAIAWGLVAGSAALAAADLAGSRARRRTDAGWGDALALGLAQACSLWPGVSRTGATLAAARARGFDRADAARLSADAALPVLLAAGVLKGVRLAREGLPHELRPGFAAGAVASLAATVAAAGVAPRLAAPLPWAAYRVALAATVLRRLATPAPPPRARRSLRSATLRRGVGRAWHDGRR